MPHLQHEPLTNINLAEKAWPKVAALSASQTYNGMIESLTWEPGNGDAGTRLITEYARMSRPVVFKHYLDRKSAAAWSLDRVRREVGDSKGLVRVGNYVSQASDPDVVEMRVADFIDVLQGRSEFPYKEHLVDGMGPYLGNMRLPSLAKQLPRGDFFPNPPMTTFWLGADAQTHLHCHQFCDVLLVQLIGKRRLILIPPHQAPMVGCVPRDINICTAVFDPFEPDETNFPRPELIHQLHYELESGDALLIPGFWFHAVRLTGPSFASSQFNQGVMPLAIGGGSSLPWQQRAYQRGWG